MCEPSTYRAYKCLADLRGCEVLELFPGDFSIKVTRSNPGSLFIKQEGFLPYLELLRPFAALIKPEVLEGTWRLPTSDGTGHNRDALLVELDGYRAALENAQNIKEDADTFVDVITAEDIGALPDRSVAEALQRVPGVNIGRFEKASDPDRFSVEGTGVIIRGLQYVVAEHIQRRIFVRLAADMAWRSSTSTCLRAELSVPISR